MPGVSPNRLLYRSAAARLSGSRSRAAASWLWSKSPPTISTERRDAIGRTREQRRDDAAAHRLGQREVRHLGREDVAHVLLQQLVGGRHADVHRLAERADGG